jgi:phenylacetate-coenzyme A ligase PaaK-like adenylate-forming protein
MNAAYTFKRLVDVGRGLSLHRVLERREHWTRAQVLELQQHRLASLVRLAVSSSPFYRDWYGPRLADGDIALDELPVLTKATMMENFDGLVTDRALRLAELERHLDGLTRDDYYRGRYRVLVTAGTSGLRGLFVYDRRAWSTVIASALRLLSMMAVAPRLPPPLRFATIGAPSPLHMTNRVAASADVGLYRALRLEATRPLDELVRHLNAFQPEILQTYPSIGALLAIEQQEGRLRIHPRVVTTNSEMRTPEMEQGIRETWRVSPFDAYGMTEVGIVGSDCSEHRGFHLNDDLAIFEAVDEANQPVPPGSPSSKLLVTNLFNHAQPLIRYEVSDMLTLAGEPCPCGRPLGLVSAIEGRSDDMLHLPGPAGRDIAVHPIQVRSALATRADIRQYQVIHDQHGLHVLVVLRNGASAEACRAAVARDLGESLAKLHVELPPIDVQVVDTIPREGGQAAKFKLVRSLLGGPTGVARTAQEPGGTR